MGEKVGEGEREREREREWERKWERERDTHCERGERPTSTTAAVRPLSFIVSCICRWKGEWRAWMWVRERGYRGYTGAV